MRLRSFASALYTIQGDYYRNMAEKFPYADIHFNDMNGELEIDNNTRTVNRNKDNEKAWRGL